MSKLQKRQLLSWSEAPLSAFAAPEPTSFVDGPFGSDLKVSDYTESGVRILQLQNLGDGYFIDDNVKYTSERKALSLSRCLVRPGDLLIAKMADPLARACIVPPHVEKGLIVADLIKLRLDREHDAIFICSAINGTEFRHEAERLATGTTRTRISLSTLKRIRLRAPKPKEQRRIGALIRTLDETIEQTESLIAKYQQIKAGLKHDLFTRGLTPDGHLRPTRAQAPHLYKESPLGLIPKEWKVKSLGVLAEIVSGVTLGSKIEISDDVLVPYLRVANVQDGYFDLKEVKAIRVSRFQFEKLQLKIGDVLMNEGGDFDKLGRGSVWQEEIKPCIHQNHVFRVRPRDGELRSHFLAFWSQSEMGKKYFVMSSKQSTNLASINSTQLNRFPVALPTSIEQERIEVRIMALNGHIDLLGQELAKLRQQKHGVMHDLLTGRVRVKSSEVVSRK